MRGSPFSPVAEVNADVLIGRPASFREERVRTRNHGALPGRIHWLMEPKVAIEK